MLLTSPILKTLAYHAKFNYPLTLSELHRFLLINYPVSSNEVKLEVIKPLRHRELCHRQSVAISSGLPRRPDPGSGLLAMTGNEKFFDLRLKRHQASIPKLRLARRAARLIGLLPWIKLVCVTGSLAMENSDPDDDIDLMIVTSPNRLWLTRPLVVLLVSLFFNRRKPAQQFNNLTIKQFSDSLCLNLWLDSSALAMPPHRRDLRTAHELAQMKPLVNKNHTYEKMLAVNKWGAKFLANFWTGVSLPYLPAEKRPTSRERIVHEVGEWQAKAGAKETPDNKTNSLLNLMNLFFFRLQFAYMKPKITTEEVNLHTAFFHPKVRRTDHLYLR